VASAKFNNGELYPVQMNNLDQQWNVDQFTSMTYALFSYYYCKHASETNTAKRSVLRQKFPNFLAPSP